jgi:hypothetical protein
MVNNTLPNLFGDAQIAPVVLFLQRIEVVFMVDATFLKLISRFYRGYDAGLVNIAIKGPTNAGSGTKGLSKEKEKPVTPSELINHSQIEDIQKILGCNERTAFDYRETLYNMLYSC